MRKPSRQPPRSTSMPQSLSRMLPKLRLPVKPVQTTKGGKPSMPKKSR